MARIPVGPAVPMTLTLALLLGCGGGPDTGESAPGQDSTPDAPPATAALPSPDSLTDAELGQIQREHVVLVLNWGGTTTRRAPPEGSEPAILREWRVRGREGFDRFVLTFGEDDPTPGYQVSFVEGPPRECASGAELETEARAFLRVNISGVGARDETGAPTFQRETSIRPRRNLKELHLTCESDGELEFVLGLAGQRDYRILEARSPRRLVVDVVNTMGG